MPNYTGDPNKTINLTTDELTTQSPGHPNTFNPKFRQMVDNDAVLNKRINDHKNASVLDHPDNSVTDAKIGNRTVNDSTAPSGDSGTITTLFGWFANMVKSITGKSNWRTPPATTLEAAKSHMDATTGVHGATSAATPNALVQRDSAGRAKFAAPSASDDAATKGYVDTKVSKSGDTMTGSLVTPSVLVPYTPSSETDSIANYPNGITYSEAVNWFGDVIGTLITVKSSINRNFQILYEYGNTANPRMLTRSWHSTPNAWSPWALAWNNLNNPASLGPNGYQKLASGLIIQWGVVQVQSGSTVTYPLAFANIPLFIGVTVINSTAHYAAVNNRSATGFTVLHDLGTTATFVTWMAIGS